MVSLIYCIMLNRNNLSYYFIYLYIVQQENIAISQTMLKASRCKIKIFFRIPGDLKNNLL